MDPRNPEQPDGQLTPLIAQLPAGVPIIPQSLITSGTRRDCIRLRNLPSAAQVTDILTFLGEFSQFIIYQGVHMVYTATVSKFLINNREVISKLLFMLLQTCYIDSN